MLNPSQSLKNPIFVSWRELPQNLLSGFHKSLFVRQKNNLMAVFDRTNQSTFGPLNAD